MPLLRIGERLAGLGTHICNKRHSNPRGHICSFLVCPGREGRCRNRVRFRAEVTIHPAPAPLYPLDSELTARMAGIRLEKQEQEGKGAGQPSVWQGTGQEREQPSAWVRQGAGLGAGQTGARTDLAAELDRLQLGHPAQHMESAT